MSVADDEGKAIAPSHHRRRTGEKHGPSKAGGGATTVSLVGERPAKYSSRWLKKNVSKVFYL